MNDYLTLGIICISLGLMLTLMSIDPMIEALFIRDFSGIFFFIGFAFGISLFIAGLFYLQIAREELK